ncbi:hypothetical protein DFH09DRAFT_1457979 [Mycena vulgaris]|nr:hypothetical protein DFH09DRAFT_1457979 [Mycena vulgaris]
MSHPPCVPPTFPANFDRAQHDADADKFYYGVIVGRVPGIYLDWEDASAQTHKCRNQKWERFSTYAEVLAFWNHWCIKVHEHEGNMFKVKGIAKIFDNYDEALAAAAAQFITTI